MRLTTIVLSHILAGVMVFGSCQLIPKAKSIYDPTILEYHFKSEEYKKDVFGNEYSHKEETHQKPGYFQKI